VPVVPVGFTFTKDNQNTKKCYGSPEIEKVRGTGPVPVRIIRAPVPVPLLYVQVRVHLIRGASRRGTGIFFGSDLFGFSISREKVAGKKREG
jgi:hypothetical protein